MSTKLTNRLKLLVLLVAVFGIFQSSCKTVAYNKLKRPLRVGIRSSPGFAAGIVANQGLKANQSCIFWKNHGLQVEFVLMDDPEVRRKALSKGAADGVDIVWSTIDRLANELPGLNHEGINARAIMVVDWSRGADSIVADKNVKTIEELKGKKTALAPFSPSSWLLEYGLENSNLSESERNEIVKQVAGKASSADASAEFIANKAEAAVVEEPHLTEALAKRPGAHSLLSTAQLNAYFLIGDIMIAREDFIKDNPEVLKAFVEGWLEGVRAANEDAAITVGLLTQSFPVYKELGPAATRAGLSSVKLADTEDNMMLFGLNGREPFFDKLFSQVSNAWLKRGYINSPLIAPSNARDTSFRK